MSVAALKPYVGIPRDAQDKFHGDQLLYIGWEQHLMFCAPLAFAVAPSMQFGEIIDKLLSPTYSYHPDYKKIDWGKVQWFKSCKPWVPDFDKTLAVNGLKHKDSLSFMTPGLSGLKGSCN